MNSSMVLSFLVLVWLSLARAGRVLVLDDGENVAIDRVRRQTLYDAPIEVERERRDNPYGAPAPYAAQVHHGPKGKVGPVYTFVKTDPKANFKWGVRHRAGAQYGRRRRRDISYVARPNPFAQDRSGLDQDTAADAAYGGGYRRGDPEHNREEYLSQKDHTFKAKLKWSDEHYYDINHGDSYKEPAPAYHEPAPAYHEPAPAYKPTPAYHLARGTRAAQGYRARARRQAEDSYRRPIRPEAYREKYQELRDNSPIGSFGYEYGPSFFTSLPTLYRTARAAQEEDSFQNSPYEQEYQEPRDNSPSGSNAYAAPAGHAGPDHVDYGAYTGGNGAFGWYTDHPVLIKWSY